MPTKWEKEVEYDPEALVLGTCFCHANKPATLSPWCRDCWHLLHMNSKFSLIKKVTELWQGKAPSLYVFRF
jgi:hypothetical protein